MHDSVSISSRRQPNHYLEHACIVRTHREHFMPRRLHRVRRCVSLRRNGFLKIINVRRAIGSIGGFAQSYCLSEARDAARRCACFVVVVFCLESSRTAVCSVCKQHRRLYTRSHAHSLFSAPKWGEGRGDSVNDHLLRLRLACVRNLRACSSLGWCDRDVIIVARAEWDKAEQYFRFVLAI